MYSLTSGEDVPIKYVKINLLFLTKEGFSANFSHSLFESISVGSTVTGTSMPVKSFIISAAFSSLTEIAFICFMFAENSSCRLSSILLIPMLAEKAILLLCSEKEAK